MKKQQQIVKVNAQNEISILTWENGTIEIAHLVNGEISYSIENDVVTFKSESGVDDYIEDFISRIIQAEFGGELEVDNQVIIEEFTYQIWVAVSFDMDRNKVIYGVSTIHENNHDKDDMDSNMAERKTWKGLANYIRRFSK